MDYDGSAIEECIRFNSVTFIYDKSKPVDSDHEVEESGKVEKVFEKLMMTLNNRFFKF